MRTYVSRIKIQVVNKPTHTHIQTSRGIRNISHTDVTAEIVHSVVKYKMK